MNYRTNGIPEEEARFMRMTEREDPAERHSELTKRFGQRVADTLMSLDERHGPNFWIPDTGGFDVRFP